MATLLAQCIRSRWSSAACLAVVLLAVALPPDGFGIPMCSFKAQTHLPCFGCGLTRAFIGMAHLNFRRAAFYHPLGAAVFPLVLLVAALLPAREPTRSRIAEWLERRGLFVNIFLSLFALAFVGYGLGRIWWVLNTHTPSPW